ncbi:patatin-like phospholipase family protein [Allopusillimonas soli]|uniref:Patatin-like phospholipase family protein n=1 Tax=Allopusillimonas soli TaxID=659016 RepID=A0A853FEK1_9BURK|nr:patatin-like phospholipase family protein [Allopusillimonas soli]NYT38493.1 patatin-like phospholipase family protein [Allopusillimonas soli]TEA71784.1 patatin-like phospholipase family protein [Allopusillimonas soli]
MPTVQLEPRAHPGATGLVLTGGGARAAYQVGVLSGILDILDPGRTPGFRNPFDIICGSSAGAVNAASLACHANDVHESLRRLELLWGNLHAGKVYHADAPRLLLTGLRWLGLLVAGWAIPATRSRQPRALLDNSPLRALLTKSLDFDQLQRNLDDGYLQTVAITAAAYTTGEHLTFYQSTGSIEPWRRPLRRALPTRLNVDHLMASSSIPFIFPAQSLQVQGLHPWCGDGSMRQLAPLSPAIHLGAQRIMVVGTGHKDDIHPEDQERHPPYPSLAQIGGHALSNIFLDSLSMDVERMQRINDLLALLPANVLKTQSLRPVSIFVMTPSRSLDELALAHIEQLPRAARTLFRVLGVSSSSGPTTGGALISYLLFESGFTQELIRLGRADSMSRVEEVKAFFKETQ